MRKCYEFPIAKSNVTFVFDLFVLGEDIKSKRVVSEPKLSTKMYNETRYIKNTSH